jgi:hypothetical protein
MPKPKGPDEERGRREGEQREREEHTKLEHGHQHERHDDKDRPRRRRMGREHAVHQQIIERRLGGGAPATPEAYARGLEEWNQLPGSVVRPPTDEKPATKNKKQGSDDADKENRP